METFTIREAAERCEVSYQAVRKRVDRGSVQVVHKDGVRRIPQAELERAGLWPGARMGAPAEVQRLQGENACSPSGSTPSARLASTSSWPSTRNEPRSKPW
jgi:hypothetical protein